MARPQNVTELLRDLVAIPSVNPTGDPGTDGVGEQAIGEYVADFLRGIGAEVALDFIEPGRPNVVAVFAPPGAPAKGKLAFAPHLDTVSVAGMTIAPFDPVVSDGKLWGRGASDTKGPMAAALWALGEWAQSPARARARVEWTLLAVMDEEATNKGARAAAAGDFASDLVVVLEPTDLRVVTAHKGAIWLDVFTHGVACHGSTPERGRNAIYAMRQVLEILEEKIAPDLARRAHGKLGGASLSVGTISGGSKINIVPDRCRIEVDVRLVPGLKPEAVRAEIEAALQKEIPEVEVKEQRHSAPLDTSESLPWVKRLGEMARGFATAPWFSDASVLSRADRPAVCVGPGSIAQAHTKDEFILLRDLEEGADFFPALDRVGRIMKGLLRKSVGVFREGLRDYGRAAGHAPAVWIALAALNLAVQIYFRRQLAPGEFALLNTLIGAVDLMAVPLLALRQAIAYFPAPGGEAAPRGKMIREAEVPLVQNATLVWAFFCALFFLPALDLLGLPRFTLGLFALPNVLILLGGCFGAALYRRQNRLRFWAFLLVFAGLIRLLAAFVFAGAEPWAEAGLAAGACAGLVLLTPILRPVKLVFAWEKTRAALSDREFRLYLGATLSVMLGIFLFINADRILAQLWFGRPTDNNFGFVRWGLFDGYQTAGLLGRALLWSTQPILLVLLARRAPVERTSREVRTLFWFYGAKLIGAAVLLALFARPLAHLFGGANEEITAYFVPRFALAMVPLGFAQGIGFFVLASRRYPECFTLGAGGVAYALFLALVGKPQLIQSYMFGGGTVVLLIVLFIGIARWGRRQP